MKIKQFRNQYGFLSNFYPSNIIFEGKLYPTAEHAYQAQKTIVESEREKIRKAKTAGLAKKLGREVTIRPNWDSIKFQIMYNIVYQKFLQNTSLKVLLLETGDAILEEENTWGDTYWGTCRGEGKNYLGVILMKIRDDLLR